MLQRQFLQQGQRGQLAYDAATLLGHVGYGAAPESTGVALRPSLRIPLEMLETGRAAVDLWHSVAPARSERHQELAIATDERWLFGCMQLDEQSAGGLRAAARKAYELIFATLDRSSCPHPLRFWNYVPRINEPLDRLERYRHFNVGRQEAFLTAHRAAFVGAPAACAIGTEAQALMVYFLAARDAPLAIENPRQVSAYHYPSEYGPRSPTFSRATLTMRERPTLFISGTASIVGHRSEHTGDASAQTRETFANLRAVVDAANARLGTPAFALDQLIYTVYVRHAADFAGIKGQFDAAAGATSFAARNAIFLRGDVCRAELLVEIEASSAA